MNRKLLFLLGVVLAGGAYIAWQSPKATATFKSVQPRIDTKKPLTLTPSQSQIPSQFSIQSPASIDSQESQLIKDYQAAAYELAEKIEKLGLDGDELNETLAEVGPEAFINAVPEELRPYYQKLEETITEMRASYLTKDGMSEKFFTRYQVQMPDWIKKQREELEVVNLPTQVEALVRKKMNEAQINNDEINEILLGCGRGNATCINKSFALLIDANHGLEEGQIKMIQEYL